MATNNNEMDAAESALHLIERKYAQDTLFNEVCGAAALCALSRTTAHLADISDLGKLLSSCGVERQCANLITRTIGDHWHEYREWVGRFSDDDLTDLFERRYIPEIAEKVSHCHTLDVLSLLLLDIKPQESFLDLCCGAGFLVGQVWMARQGLRDESHLTAVTGVEFNEERVRYAGILSFIRGTGAKIHGADCFNPRFLRAKYDKIHCEAPFGMSVRHLDFANVRQTISKAFPDFPPISLTSADWLFAARAVAAMDEGGKAVVIMPEAALSSTQSAPYRRYFVARGLVDSVIALPGGIYPGTNIGIAVVTFARHAESTKLFDVSAHAGSGTAPLNCSQIVSDLSKLANYGGVVTRTREQILREDADLAPALYLRSPARFANTKPLGELVEAITRGVALPKDDLARLSAPSGKGATIRYLAPGSISDGVIVGGTVSLLSVPEKCADAVAQTGDLVVSRSGPPFKVAVVDNPSVRYVADGNLIVCRPRGIDPFYLQGYLESAEGSNALLRSSSGIQRTLSAKRLLTLPIPVMDAEKEREVGRAVRKRCERMRMLKAELEDLSELAKTQFVELTEEKGTADGN